MTNENGEALRRDLDRRVERVSAWQARGEERRMKCVVNPLHKIPEPRVRHYEDGGHAIVLKCVDCGHEVAVPSFMATDTPPPPLDPNIGRAERDIAHW